MGCLFAKNRPLRRPAATPAQHRGKMGMHLWQVVGRHVPTDRNPKPKIFRMKVFAEDEVRARRLAFSSHAFQRSGAGKLAALPAGALAGAGVHGDAGLTEG